MPLKSNQDEENAIVSGKVPLTLIQKQFFTWQFDDRKHFNQSNVLIPSVKLNHSPVQQAINKLALHYDMLFKFPLPIRYFHQDRYNYIRKLGIVIEGTRMPLKSMSVLKWKKRLAPMRVGQCIQVQLIITYRIEVNGLSVSANSLERRQPIWEWLAENRTVLLKLYKVDLAPKPVPMCKTHKHSYMQKLDPMQVTLASYDSKPQPWIVRKENIKEKMKNQELTSGSILALDHPSCIAEEAFLFDGMKFVKCSSPVCNHKELYSNLVQTSFERNESLCSSRCIIRDEERT
ncbi:hypothetical protein BC833DRAFT_635960 [Globomyces pollinis-pini]|nr:hypothetical protein BC833DRAFT_635960 [Globomyces pollinis-pini]